MVFVGSLLAAPAAASTRSSAPSALRADSADRDGQLRLAELLPGETPGDEPAPTFPLGLSPSELTRLATGIVDFGVPGPEGRVSSRNGAPFRYDLEGRRLEDDRFTYAWSWRGELVSATVKPCWPLEPLVTPTSACAPSGTQPPYANQKVV